MHNEIVNVDDSWITEICCDYCNEPIHNHFECPCCKDKSASTSMYHEPEKYEEFECEECDSKFIYLGFNNVSCEREIEIVKNNYKGKK